MLSTARRAISYPNPDRTDRPDIPAHLGYLAAALDVDVLYVQGTDAARLAAAHQSGGGKFWWTTDTLIMWYDDGAAWQQVGLQNQVGTYAGRPAASSVSPGTRYFATDTLGEWRSTGSAWTLLVQGRPLVSTVNFALAPFTTPYDGQEVTLDVDTTNGVRWHLRYNAGSASAYKWEFIGGSRLGAYNIVSNSSNSSTWVDTATSSVLTISRAGEYTIDLQGRGGTGLGGSGLQVWGENWGVSINNATPTLIANFATANPPSQSYFQWYGSVGGRYKVSLAASDTVRAKFNGTGVFNVTDTLIALEVTPIRIS